MKLKLGFSTCPNDTFIFDALVHHKIDTESLDFEVLLADVETLNQQAFDKQIDITKISYHAYAHLVDSYSLLDSGSALGFGNGPLLISKRKIYPDEVQYARIAIPGKLTTANLLLSIAFPDILERKEYVFSQIEEAILSGEVDAGVIIHENRFTYSAKGLQKIIDLGENWEKKTNLPIPLGGIIVNKSLPIKIQQTINRVLRRSVEFAQSNPQSAYFYVKNYAKEMDDTVIYNHIKLYVNEFTTSLGEKGKQAINTLFEQAMKSKIIPPNTQVSFVQS